MPSLIDTFLAAAGGVKKVTHSEQTEKNRKTENKESEWRVGTQSGRSAPIDSLVFNVCYMELKWLMWWNYLSWPLQVYIGL